MEKKDKKKGCRPRQQESALQATPARRRSASTTMRATSHPEEKGTQPRAGGLVLRARTLDRPRECDTNIPVFGGAHATHRGLAVSGSVVRDISSGYGTLAR